MYLAIKVPNDPTRAEALVAHDGGGISVIGFASPADRDVLIPAYGATRVNVSVAQYDDYLAHADDT